MKSKAAVTIVLIPILIGMVALAFKPIPARAVAQVNILTHSGWLDTVGYYHVSGETQNGGDTAASLIKVTATFYDSGNTVVATDFTYTDLDILLPGRKSPFEVLLIDTTQAAKVDHYSLSLTFSTTSSIPTGLQILSSSSYTDAVNYMHVVGEIKNIESSAATLVKVVATFYDSGGTVVATDFTYSDPNEISPSQTAPFEVLLIYSNRVTLVASYALSAQSQQYATVPEFPTFLVLPLLIFLTMFAVLVKKSLRNLGT